MNLKNITWIFMSVMAGILLFKLLTSETADVIIKNTIRKKTVKHDYIQMKRAKPYIEEREVIEPQKLNQFKDIDFKKRFSHDIKDGDNQLPDPFDSDDAEEKENEESIKEEYLVM